MYSVSLGGVLFPVAPEKITTKIKNANKTLTLINEGEINFIKQAGLTEFEFDILLPAVHYPFAKYENYEYQPPVYYLNKFEQIKTRKNPVQFSILRISPNGKRIFDTNITVSLESYTVKENAKEGFDLIVSVKLKQFRTFETKIVKVISETNTAKVEPVRGSNSSPSPKPEKQTTYTVKKGDTLSIIARKFYGDGSKYMIIYNANKDKITNPNLIHPNQVLVIPSI